MDGDPRARSAPTGCRPQLEPTEHGGDRHGRRSGGDRPLPPIVVDHVPDGRRARRRVGTATLVGIQRSGPFVVRGPTHRRKQFEQRLERAGRGEHDGSVAQCEPCDHHGDVADEAASHDEIVTIEPFRHRPRSRQVADRCGRQAQQVRVDRGGHLLDEQRLAGACMVVVRTAHRLQSEQRGVDQVGCGPARCDAFEAFDQRGIEEDRSVVDELRPVVVDPDRSRERHELLLRQAERRERDRARRVGLADIEAEAAHPVGERLECAPTPTDVDTGPLTPWPTEHHRLRTQGEREPCTVGPGGTGNRPHLAPAGRSCRFRTVDRRGADEVEAGRWVEHQSWTCEQDGLTGVRNDGRGRGRGRGGRDRRGGWGCAAVAPRSCGHDTGNDQPADDQCRHPTEPTWSRVGFVELGGDLVVDHAGVCARVTECSGVGREELDHRWLARRAPGSIGRHVSTPPRSGRPCPRERWHSHLAVANGHPARVALALARVEC